MQKIKVILDTDVANEIDDEFAISYLLKSLDVLDLEAITIAPFCKTKFQNISSIEEGVNLSFDKALSILDLMKMPNYKNKMFKGATKYFFESKITNSAVDEIIEIAKANDKTTIIAIGAITNVALALYHAPEIVDKVSIVWLGGHSIEYQDNSEFNFRQDIEAVDFVFKSKADLTIIPGKNVASHMSTSIFELKNYLKNAGLIGKHLLKIFQEYKKDNGDKIGESKVLWDLSAVAFCINQDWFKFREISRPDILKNGTYKETKDTRKINYVYDLDRDKIYRDFFIKIGV